jgi:diguanylate cyclase (GGDEF)-like protein
MSDLATANVVGHLSTAEVPPLDGARSVSTVLPQELWTVVARHLEESSEIFWIILSDDWAFRAASSVFLREIVQRGGRQDASFLGTLPPTLAAELSLRRERGTLDLCELELVHPVPSGNIAVSYRVYKIPDGWFFFGRDDSHQLELVSQMTALLEDMETEMQRERDLSNQLRTLLSSDELTGLSNRRKFYEVLTVHWNSFIASGTNFGVITIDIDHFKQVNDRFGHPVGDEVLRRVGRLIQSSVRAEDTAARFGGEEFLLLAADVDDDPAAKLAERIRRRVELTPMPNGVGRVTISLGVATTSPVIPLDSTSLLARSDLAMYSAKSSGRNRVEIASARDY